MPDLIKLQAPDNCDSFSASGQEYDVSDDGTVDVPADVVVDLLSHGFIVAADQSTTPPTKKRGKAAEA